MSSQVVLTLFVQKPPFVEIPGLHRRILWKPPQPVQEEHAKVSKIYAGRKFPKETRISSFPVRSSG